MDTSTTVTHKIDVTNLTADEQSLLNAYRAQALAAILAEREAANEPDAKTISAVNLHESLDSAERLSLYIIGTMALNHTLNHSLLKGDNGNGINWLWKEIAAAIREGLPRVDHMEIKWLCEGKPLD